MSELGDIRRPTNERVMAVTNEKPARHFSYFRFLNILQIDFRM